MVEAQKLWQTLQTLDPLALQNALGRAALERLGAYQQGVALYQNHPYRRTLEPAPVQQSWGTTHLRRYTGPGGRTALFIPSLVNRADVLDLKPGRSLLRWAAQNGLDPWLLDWGDPGAEELRFSLDDYIARIRAAHAWVHEATGAPPILVGYCMGGTLTLAAALGATAPLGGVVMMAAPWDFHADLAAQALAALWTQPWLGPAFSGHAPISVDMLQMLFQMPDPAMAFRKFRQFASMDTTSPKAEDFVALEDWLNDGIPLAGPVGKTVREDWYGRNLPGRGLWQVAGQRMDPTQLDAPLFLVVPQEDRLVPPASALALQTLPQADILRPPSGHIGMVVGSRGEQGLWRPLRDWILAQPFPTPRKPKQNRKSAPRVS